MTIVFDKDPSLTRGEGTAANDDHVGHTRVSNRAAGDQIAKNAGETGGWDAYEVWRRLIKDARERRAGRSFPQ